MKPRPFLTPAHFSNISNRWVKAGVDPRQFFLQDGTVLAEFFVAPEEAARARAAAAHASAPPVNPFVDFAAGSGSCTINATK
ncbi:MAG: hypothetical protein ACRYFK_20405 [Janthinobacterium lividum]